MSRDPFEETSASDRDYGPEWWAMDREFFCESCGHSAYRHRERLSDADLAPCGECACEDFELDNQ